MIWYGEIFVRIVFNHFIFHWSEKACAKHGGILLKDIGVASWVVIILELATATIASLKFLHRDAKTIAMLKMWIVQ